MIIYLYDWFQRHNRDRVVVIVRHIAGAYFGCSREYHTGSCRVQTLLGPAPPERSGRPHRRAAYLDEYPHVVRPRSHAVGTCPTSTRSASPPGYAGRLTPLVFRAQPRAVRLDADAGIRTRITAGTGPYARRITPRRHVAPAGIEPATSGFNVRRPSPTETSGLGVVAADAAGNRASDS